MRPRSSAIAAVIVLSLTSARGAFAAPNGGDKALAETLFREGRTLVQSNRLPEACEKFAESQRIEPKLGTLLYLATCHEQTGRVASAWAEYEEAATLAERSHEPERQRVAAERARALEPKLARVRIVVASPTEGLTVRLDQRELGAASTGVPLPLDPGAHLVEASAPQHATWRAELSVKAGEALDVQVPALAPVAPPPSNAPAPAPSPTPPPPPQEAPGPAVSPLTVVLGGVGVAGIAVGTIFGLTFFAQRNDGLAACDGATCTAKGLDRLDAARTSSLISGIGFGVGAAALVGAVVVHVTGVGRGGTTVAIAPNGLRVGAEF